MTRIILLLAIVLASFSMATARASGPMAHAPVEVKACAMKEHGTPAVDHEKVPGMALDHCAMACVAIVSVPPRMEQQQKIARENPRIPAMNPLPANLQEFDLPPPKA